MFGSCASLGDTSAKARQTGGCRDGLRGIVNLNRDLIRQRGRADPRAAFGHVLLPLAQGYNANLP